MPKGGARVHSGPPPDPNALRRERAKDKDGWTTLPAEGRKGALPKWPLPPEVRTAAALEASIDQREMLEAQIDGGVAPKGAVARLAKLDQLISTLRATIKAAAKMEATLWKDLWSTPQAVAWETLRWTREVALYVRWQVLAELGDLDAGKEARQWSDRLGLNPAAMLRNRWRISRDEVAAQRQTRPAAPAEDASGRSMRDRLKAVTGGGA